MLGVRGRYRNLGKYLLEYTRSMVKELKRQVDKPRSRSYKSGTYNTPLNDTGSLKNSISYKLQNLGEDSYKFSISGNSYGLTIEKGGVQNVSRNGQLQLKNWAKRKLGLQDAAARSVAYKTAQKFADTKQGRKPVPFITQAMEKKEDGLGNLILGGIVEKDVAENIEQILIEAGYAKKGDEFILQ